MYNDFEILRKNNTNELIFYKMLERKKNKEKIQYLYLVNKKKKIKSKIIEEKELIPYF